MCLTVDLNKTKKLLNSKKKEFIFYKAFRKKDGELFSLFRYAEVDRVNKLPEFKKNVFNGSILKGGAFHAHLTKKRAIDTVIGRPFLSVIILLPIHVKREHIAAVGVDGDVCFIQYEIKKRTYKQALKTDRFACAKQMTDIHYETDEDGDFSSSCPFVLNDYKIGSGACYRCIHNKAIDNRRRRVYCAHPDAVKLLK